MGGCVVLRVISRAVSMIVCIILICVNFIGCSSTGNSGNSSPVIQDSRLELATLKFYFMGDEGKDSMTVLDEKEYTRIFVRGFIDSGGACYKKQ